MGKITIVWLLISTVVVVVAFANGTAILRGGDVSTHLYWGLAALLMTLAGNLFAIFHAAQTDRLIRALRDELERRDRSPSID